MSTYRLIWVCAQNEKMYHVTLLLNPRRHSVLLAAKVHWTVCFPLATSGGGLAFASLKVFSSVYVFNSTYVNMLLHCKDI